jgi:hypothetical protein
LKSLANIVQKRTLYPRKKTAFFLNGILYSLDEGLLIGKGDGFIFDIRQFRGHP